MNNTFTLYTNRLLVTLFVLLGAVSSSFAQEAPTTFGSVAVPAVLEYFVVPESSPGLKDDYIKIETSGLSGASILFSADLNGQRVEKQLNVDAVGYARLPISTTGLYENVQISHNGRTLTTPGELLVMSRSIGISDSYQPAALDDTDVEYTGKPLEDVGPDKFTGCQNNKLQNEGFESSLSSWTRSSSSSVVIVDQTQQNEYIYAGHRAMKLDNPGAWAYQTFSMGANRNFCFSVYAKNHASAGTFSVGVKYFSAGGSEIGNHFVAVARSSGYNLYSFDDVTPPGTSSVQVLFYRDGSTNNNGWVDAVCFQDKGNIIDGGTPPASFNADCGDGQTVDAYVSDVDCSGSPHAITNIPSSSQVYQVVVEVVYKGANPGQTTTVMGSDGNQYLVSKANVPNQGNSSFHIYRGLIPNSVSWVSHTATAGQCTNNTQNNSGLQSLASFVFRNITVEKAGSGVFTALTGYNSIAEFDLPIPTSDLTRDITMKVPFSEITLDGRYVTLNAVVDGVVLGSQTWTFGPAGSDCCIDLLEFNVPNVPGGASVITVQVDTRNGQGPGGVNGQSYTVAGLAYADVDCPKNDGDCVLEFRAKGNCGGEQLQLRLDGSTVATYILSNAYQTYTYNNFTTGSNVAIYFVNDQNSVCDYNANLDYVKVGDDTYQTSSSATNTNTSCNSTSNEGLYCNGGFDFGKIDCITDPCEIDPVLAAIECSEDPLKSRSASSSTLVCTSGNSYGLYFQPNGLLQNHSAGSFWLLSNASFVENTNGTAIFTGTATDASNSSLKFDFSYFFRGRTFTPPSGSPVENSNCIGNVNNSDWYYYTELEGTLTGKNSLAGATVAVERRGGAFQVGTGANLNQASNFGASGWTFFNVISQPTSGPSLQTATTGDVNINLGGSTIDKNAEDCYDICEHESVTITARGFGGNGNYTYAWSNGGSGSSINVTPLSTTTYTVTITDGQGCSDTDQTTVNVRQNYDNGGVIGTNQTGCSPYDPQVITNQGLPSGGDEPGSAAEYVWLMSTGNCTPPTIDNYGDWVAIPGANGQSYDPGVLTETTCFIRCARIPGCELYLGESNVVTITVEESVSVTVNNATVCEGESASLTANPAPGADSDFSYLWSNGATTQTLNFNNAQLSDGGSYTVTVTNNASGCTATASGTLRIREEPNVSVTSGNPTCGEDNGSITFTFGPQDGRSNIAFSINGGTYQSVAVATGTYMVNDLDAGSYSLSVRWGDTDCPVTLPSVTLVDENGPSVTASSNASICTGGSVDLSASVTGGNGNITYSWNQGAGAGATVSVSPTSTTTYTVTATDANGCRSTDQVTVTVVPDPEITITPDGTDICEGGSVSFTSETSGGLDCTDVRWDFRSGTSGAYTNNIALGATYTSETDLVPGTYQFRARYNCNGTDCDNAYSNVVTINVVANPEVTLAVTDNTLCLGETASLTATPSGGLDCDDVIIRFREGTSGAWTTVTTGNTYTIPANLAVGTYQYNARLVCNGTSCVNDNSNTVTITVKPDPTGTIADKEICADESATLTVVPTVGDAPFTYAWSDGGGTSASASFSPSATKDYTVTITDANGCSASVEGTITVKPQPEANITATPTSICTEEAVTFTATTTVSGSAYSWNFGQYASPATATGAGPHVVTYTLPASQNGNGTATASLTVSRDGCEDSDTQSVTIKDNPEVIDVTSTNPTCGEDNGTITISYVDNPNRTGIKFSIDGGVSYPYSTSDNQGSYTISNLSDGTYDVFVIWGADDCPVDAEDATLVDENGPSVTASSNASICIGGSVDLSASVTGGNGNITYSWNQGAGAGAMVTVTPTSTTTYTVTATDANGCSSADQVTVTVVPDAEVTITSNGTDICEGGTITFESEVSGGLDCRDVRWQIRPVGGSYVTVADADTYTSAADLAPGDYQIRAQYICDGEGCNNDNSNTINITVVEDPVVTLAVTDNTLCLGETATLTATPSGGLDCSDVIIRFREGTTGSWTNVATGNSYEVPTDLAAGTYQYNARLICSGTDCDADNSNNVTITVKPAPAGSIADQEICDGGSATLTVNTTVGDVPFTYAWSDGGGSGASATFSPSTTTTYTVTITDANGCSTPVMGTINVKPQPVADITAAPSSVCDDESVTFTAGNTVAGTTYTWNFGANASPATATGAGPHSVTYNNNSTSVTTSTVTLDVSRNGCTDDAETIITVRPQPEVTITSESGPSFCSASNGSFEVSVVKPAGLNVEISIDGGVSYEDCGQTSFTGLPAGSYNVFARFCDAPDCAIEVGNVTLDDPLSPVAGINGPDEICTDASGNNTEAVFSAVNAGLLSTYEWDFGPTATPQTATGRTPGAVTFSGSGTRTVTLTVTRLGCTSSDDFTVTVYEAPTVVIEDVTVCRNSNATLEATITGGEAPYTYAWSNGNTNETATYLSVQVEQTATVTITDANGCSTVASGTIFVNPLPLPDVSDDDIICLGETKTLQVERVLGSQNTPYVYRWYNLDSPGVTLSTTDELEVTPGLGTHNFVVMVSDANGCEESDIVEITVVPKPTVTVEDASICDGENTTLTAVAGGGNGTFAYLWNTGATTPSIEVSPSSTTDYSVTVTSSYSDSDSEADCTAEATSTVTVRPQPVAGITPSATEICDDESVTFTADNTVAGTNYSWNFGANATPATATGAGPHEVTYSNNDATSVVTNTATLTVSRDGCNDETEVNITVRPQPEVSITAEVDPTSCEGTEGSISVNVTKPSGIGVEISLDGGVTYESCDQTTFAGLTAGTYSLFARFCNAPDCAIEIGTVILEDPDAPLAEISGPSEICEDVSDVNTTAVFSATDAGAGAIYTWNFGAGATPATATGRTPAAVSYATDGLKTIILTVVRNGCTAEDQFTLEVNDAPVVTVDDVTICRSSNATLEAIVTGGEAPFTYAWSNGNASQAAIFLSVQTEQTASVTITDANGCSTVATGMIFVNPLPLPDASDDDIICLGESKTLHVERILGSQNAPYVYRWYDLEDPGVTLSTTDELEVTPGLGSHNYVVMVTDANGCGESDIVEITVVPEPTVTVEDKAICNGESTTLTAVAGAGNGSFVYEWSTGETTPTISVSPTATTDYSVTVTSSYMDSDSEADCTAEATATVTVNENPTVAISNSDDNNVVCENQEVTLTANVVAGSGISPTVEWTVNNNATVVSTDLDYVVNPTETSTYTVKVTDENGCTDTDEVTITVDPTACASLGNFVWVDTNGNGINDEPVSAGVDGVTVNLKDENGDVIATTTTDENGVYGFTGLVPGTYSVQFELPTGFLFTGANAGAENVDSDATPTGPMQGMTETVVLEEGDDYIDLDAGLYETASLGDFVFLDEDADGQQDAGEEGIEDVVVNLLDENGDVVATTTTDENGFYEFTDLTPGDDYQVEFVSPAGLQASPANVGDDASDSDADETTGLSQIVVLESGENNPTIDAGFYETASLGDFVFLDENADGQQDAGEEGIEDVVVNLLDENGDVVATTTTDENGFYEFVDLTPGEEYVVEFETPAGYEPTPSNQGDDATDSDADETTGQSDPVVLESGENNPTIDAGFYETASIGDFVFTDEDADGQQDAGEEGIEDVVVNLLDENGDVVA
ncbi:SdrD B-like domain-containing protein, partial [Neolewinella aurantiaca]